MPCECESSKAFLVVDPHDVRMADDEQRDAVGRDAGLRHVQNDESLTSVVILGPIIYFVLFILR